MKIARSAAASCLIILVTLLSSCAGLFLQPWTGDEQGDPLFLEDVDSLVRTVMRKNDIPGLSIAVVHAGSTLVLRGYGDADREAGLPATPDTVFRAYSLAKVFAGLEVVLLAQDGLVDLDAPLASAVPEWPQMRRWEESESVTLRHLLAHRGGLPRNSCFRPEGGVPIDDVLRLQVESLANAWAPLPAETRYQYSNVGFNTLGRAVEAAREQSFAVYMHTTAFPAYGMNSTAFFTGLLPPEAELATGYIHEGSRFVPTVLYDINLLAAGNLFTTATDMAAFMTSLLETTPASSGRLSHESLWTTYTPQFDRPSDPDRSGLAWRTSEALAGELMVSHQGGDADFNAFVALFPESRTGVCILTNSGSYEGLKLTTLAVECRAAVSSYQSNPAPVTPAVSVAAAPVAAISPATHEQSTGRYSALGQLLTITEEHGELRADLGPVDLRMEPEGQMDAGTVYSLDHWLAPAILDSVLPADLELMRIIVPPVEAGAEAPHVWLALSDYAYEYCPRYDAPLQTPDSWQALQGEYSDCTVTIEDDALHMSGVGYLREREPGYFVVAGGMYDSETVTVDLATGALSHQGFVYTEL